MNLSDYQVVRCSFGDLVSENCFTLKGCLIGMFITHKIGKKHSMETVYEYCHCAVHACFSYNEIKI